MGLYDKFSSYVNNDGLIDDMIEGPTLYAYSWL